MPAKALTSIKGTTISEEAVASFSNHVAGQVIQPGNDAYERARHIWNASINRYPGLIVRCLGAADVIASIDFAREHDLRVAVRGGGHNVGGRALCDDGLVIDMSLMKGVYVDPRTRTATVQGGATLGDVDRETHLHGLAVAAGVVSKTGIAGLTLGGGVGWLVRRFGLACDNVISMQVATADGRLLTASADENADLFWALRGGGGNFGAVTSFVYRAHPVNTVLGGLIAWPRQEARDVLRFYRDFTESAPDELTAYAALVHTPDGTTPIVAVIACYSGEIAEGERLLGPLREFGTPVLDAFQEMPFPTMQSILDGGFPDGNYNYWKSTFVDELSDEMLDVLVDFANRNTSPLTASLIECYGGAANRVPVSETAFAQRRSKYNVGIMPQWSDPSKSEQHIRWARDFFEALQPFSNGGYLLNFLDQEGDDIVRAAFGENYARLVEVKNKYDPTNFFRLNQNVKPSV